MEVSVLFFTVCIRSCCFLPFCNAYARTKIKNVKSKTKRTKIQSFSQIKGNRTTIVQYLCLEGQVNIGSCLRVLPITPETSRKLDPKLPQGAGTLAARRCMNTCCWSVSNKISTVLVATSSKLV